MLVKGIGLTELAEKLTTAVNEMSLTTRQLQLLNQPALAQDVIIDQLIVYKSKREMEAYANGKLVKIYPISIGQNAIGHKQYEGDKRTPEGIYWINDRNPNSGYHKNLGISYPNQQDIANAEKLGKPAGGDIKIHGIRNGLGEIIAERHLLANWTNGCIAVTDREIDELYRAVKTNALIDIRP